MRNTHTAGGSGAFVMAVLAPALGPVVAHADSIRDGNRALKSGHLEEAMRSYQTAAGQGLAQGEGGVGRVWLRRGQLDEAMSAFRRAQGLDPQLALANYGQGEVLRRRDSCSAAVPMLAQATRLDRTFPEARLALAERLVSRWKFDAARGTWALAIPELQAAVALDSSDAHARFSAQRYDEALDTTGALDGEACRQLGYYCLLKNRWSASIPHLDRSTKLDAQDAQSWVRLGQAHQNSGDRQRASTCYRKVLALDPGNAPARKGPRSLAGTFVPAPEPQERLSITSEIESGFRLTARPVARARDRGRTALPKAATAIR